MREYSLRNAICFSSYYFIDTLLGLVIAIIAILTLSPILVSSGWILLQTTPSHILGQLDKLLSEVQTLGMYHDLSFKHVSKINFLLQILK